MRTIPIPKHVARRLALAFALALLVLACAVAARDRGPKVPPQQWNTRRGPVVPHDTFPRDCSLCHAGSSWNSIRADFTFDHGKETGVVLEGAHATAECLRCHNDRGPVADFASRGCIGCHADTHRGKLGSNCASCHDATGWSVKAEVARHNRTRFPLVGAHVAVECSRCHPGSEVGNFDRASTQCSDCHAADLARATNPDHVAQGWVTDCQRCHIPTSWGGGGFNHFAFPLSGQHAALACDACHSGGVFNQSPTQCVGCHDAQYQATTQPPHAAAGFPTTCESCHSTSGWTRATFDHSGFPLTGSHASATCSACHQGGVYNGLPTACVACHQAEYNATNDPNHANAGYPTTCQQCHTTVAWTRANFNHAGVTRNCVQCHQAEFNATTNPPHASTGYPTTCQQCHTTNAWMPANFNHAGVTRNCISCHQADYAGTNDPNHATAGFPTACQQCHNTNTWSGATFSHPQFPINSGAHHSLTCAQCHPVPRNFAQFTCTNCHAHLQPQMNNDHDRVSNYTYVSSACYQCHPTGHGD